MEEIKKIMEEQKHDDKVMKLIFAGMFVYGILAIGFITWYCEV